jgi:hypothetical protein
VEKVQLALGKVLGMVQLKHSGLMWGSRLANVMEYQ